MFEIEMLKRLASEADVQINVLARICKCSPSAISNYIKGISFPSDSKLMNIKTGLEKYKKLINDIIRE